MLSLGTSTVSASEALAIMKHTKRWSASQGFQRIYPALFACLIAALFSTPGLACSGDDIPRVGSEAYFPLAYGDRPTTDQLTALGRRIFFDPGLSASGKMACSSCHDPANAYGPPNNLAVQFGGANMNKLGFRNTPSLRYLHSPIAFTEHFIELEVTGSQDDEGPTGGRTWDGRVSSAHEQALMPLLDQNEMANANNEEIIAHLRKAPYAEEFRRTFSAPGEDVFDNSDATVGWLTVALAAFEQSPADFHPFTSKYDAYLRDQVQLTAQEQRGLALFNDMRKGNCASCHPSTTKNPRGRPPLFTDFGFIATGAPRNMALPANRDPLFYDLGLCGPLRRDLSNRPDYCGSFRTPTLRNVALRKNYFHNGVFHSLRDVVDFYVTRDTHPEKWFPRSALGQIAKFNDLPPQYHGNVNNDPPFAPLAGNKPRLNAAEIDAVVAFLETLSDGYTPSAKRATLAHR